MLYVNIYIYIYIYIYMQCIYKKFSCWSKERIKKFQLVLGLYRGLPLFFWSVYLSLHYPSLIFDMILSLYVCVCV